MSDKIMTIEQIDAHIEKHAQAKSLDICGTYKTVKPILVFAKSMLFFKPKWKTVLQTLIDVLDKQCGK
ncbi:MAG: hypothetical protein ABI760_11140 [Ferruginibacter sp.]